MQLPTAPQWVPHTSGVEARFRGGSGCWHTNATVATRPSAGEQARLASARLPPVAVGEVRSAQTTAFAADGLGFADSAFQLSWLIQASGSPP